MGRPRKEAAEVEAPAVMEAPETVEAIVVANNVWTHEGRFYQRARITIPAADVALYGERIVVI